MLGFVGILFVIIGDIYNISPLIVIGSLLSLYFIFAMLGAVECCCDSPHSQLEDSDCDAKSDNEDGDNGDGEESIEKQFEECKIYL